MNSERQLAPIGWSISILVSALAVFVWGQAIGWQFGNLSTYRLFPLFGLLAFGLMWSQNLVAFLRRHIDFKPGGMVVYYRLVGWPILLCIVAHPTLLIWQLWRDGFGLPPGSYKEYVGPAAGWAVTVSSAAFLVFIAYELRRLYKKRSWWKYVLVAGDLALIGIFFHALRLGTNLQDGWFRYVWWFYGLTLLIMLADKYLRRPNNAKA